MIKFAIDPVRDVVYTTSRFPSDLSTETALNHAIRKWEYISAEVCRRASQAGTYAPSLLVDGGVKSCGLCAKFYRRDYSPSCAGCPVSQKTGLVGCAGTPYNHFSEAINIDEQRAGAKAMVDFLKSLKRPTEAKKRPIKRPPRKTKRGNTTPPIRIRYGTSPALHLHQRRSV